MPGRLKSPIRMLFGPTFLIISTMPFMSVELGGRYTRYRVVVNEFVLTLNVEY